MPSFRNRQLGTNPHCVVHGMCHAAPLPECLMVGVSMLCVTPSEHSDRLYSKQCRHVVAEAGRHDFGSLVLTSSMFINHMPDRCVCRAV